MAAFDPNEFFNFLMPAVQGGQPRAAEGVDALAVPAISADPFESLATQLGLIRTAEQEALAKAQDAGLFGFKNLPRYPVVETKEQEDAARADLADRGLSPAQIDDRILKFKRRGGKVKRSAIAQKAAGALGGAIQGYLAAKQGRPLDVSQLGRADERRMALQVQNIRETAQDERAVAMAKVTAVVKEENEALKRETAERTYARRNGIPTDDKDGRERDIQDIRTDIVEFEAKQADDISKARAAGTMFRGMGEERLGGKEARISSNQRIDAAIESGDLLELRDEDFANTGRSFGSIAREASAAAKMRALEEQIKEAQLVRTERGAERPTQEETEIAREARRATREKKEGLAFALSGLELGLLPDARTGKRSSNLEQALSLFRADLLESGHSEEEIAELMKDTRVMKLLGQFENDQE